jgi:PEGA domain
VWYAEGAGQHRKPKEPATGQQPAQPRQPPQATPRDGQKPAPDSPANQAVPRPPDARRDPDRPRRGPERGPVIVTYPGWPWWGYPYPYGYPPTPWRVYADWETTSVRLDVSPNDAQVYVDGFYVGIVDDFNSSQHLLLAPGRHHVSIRLDGYESVDVDVSIDAGRTMTYRTSLKKQK